MPAAPLNAFLHIKGQQQGDIRGGVLQKGREGKILVSDYTYSLISPRDLASGLATGRRQHQPVQVVAPTGPQTPKLLKALVSNENLTEWELDVWIPQTHGGTGTGAEVLAFTIKLTNASVSEVDLNWGPLDQYSFTFQRIDWTWTVGGITAFDDWNSSP